MFRQRTRDNSWKLINSCVYAELPADWKRSRGFEEPQQQKPAKVRKNLIWDKGSGPSTQTGEFVVFSLISVVLSRQCTSTEHVKAGLRARSNSFFLLIWWSNEPHVIDKPATVNMAPNKSSSYSVDGGGFFMALHVYLTCWYGWKRMRRGERCGER